jgi:hypothetical protein
MRRFMRKHASTVAAAIVGASLTGGLFALSGPPEDSPRFNCTMHGNQLCGVKVDTLPNRDGGVKRYVLDFKVNPKGDAVAVVRPFGPGTK